MDIEERNKTDGKVKLDEGKGFVVVVVIVGSPMKT